MTSKPAIPEPVKKMGVFVNSIGETYVFHGMSPYQPQKLLDAIKAEWERAGKVLPVCPTYEVATASGEKEIHQHDEKSILTATPAEQEQWQEYLQKNAEFQGEYNTRLMKMVFLAVEVTPSDDWRSEQEFLGMPVPTKGSAAEKYAFVESRVVQSPQDIAGLMTSIFRLSGLADEAAIAEVEASFRSSLEEAFAEAGKPIPAERKLAG